MLIAVVSQKGGVGKSSISRTLVVEYTRAGWNTLLADVDASQITSNRWAEKRRNGSGIEPEVKTEVFRVTSDAIKASADYDLTVIDGAPHATRGTAEAAQAADVVLIPTGTSLDDLEPALMLGSELAKSLKGELAFVLYRTTSEAQEREARETLEQYGFKVLAGSIEMKTGYINALDSGRCLTETNYPDLNTKARNLVQGISELLGS